MSGSNQAVFMNQRSFGAPPGQEAFTTAGTFTWVAPTGVTRVSAVVVGGANIVNSGYLRFKNNITVSPGTSYTVIVGSPNSSQSSFINSGTLSASDSGGTGDGGGNGTGGSNGGAGAAGYTSGTSGGGRGGAGADRLVFCCCCNYSVGGGGGGGVGLNGQGSCGSAGAGCFGGGGGGSGGGSGTTGALYPGQSGNGGAFGGAAGNSARVQGGVFFGNNNGTGAGGGVRIIWPGCARSFPSTRTANE